MDWHSSALTSYRLRTVRIGINMTVITVVVFILYVFVPGRNDIQEVPFVGVLLLALLGAGIVAVLPWPWLFKKGWAIWMLYAWSLADIILISAAIVFTGGHSSPFFLLFVLTTVFFAASYPPRGQAVLLVATAVSYVAAIYISDGEIPVGSTFVRVAAMTLVAYITLFLSRELIRQILKQDAAERALRASEERFRRLASASTDAIWDWDLVTNDIWWSDGLETLFGHQPGLSTITAWTEQTHPDDVDHVEKSIAAAIDAGDELWADEYRFRRSDGTYAHVLDRGAIVRNAAGQAVQMIGGMTDLTERRNLEHQLLQSQKMESVGRLAGGIAHDFNNLLAVILGTLDLIQDDFEESDPRYDDLQQVRAAAHRAAGLTRQLLAFSRKQMLHPTVLDLNATLEDMLEMIHRLIGENFEVQFQPDGELGHIRADPSQIEQVFINLAVNARDAMPDGGTLRIETRNVYLDNAAVAAYDDLRPGSYAMLLVSDTGEGMDEATCARIFEPFFTTKEQGKGTGLGLSTIYGIISQSGGAIDVESRPGRGTTFTIYLPIVEEALSQVESRQDPTRLDGHETILLVEDEDALRSLTTRVLESSGYSVLSASRAEEALMLLEKHRDDVELLFTDVVMPGMSGSDLARTVRGRQPDVGVLFTSGYTADALAGDDSVEDTANFLQKPYTAEDLRRKVREVLDVAPEFSLAGNTKPARTLSLRR